MSLLRSRSFSVPLFRNIKKLPWLFGQAGVNTDGWAAGLDKYMSKQICHYIISTEVQFIFYSLKHTYQSLFCWSRNSKLVKVYQLKVIHWTIAVRLIAQGTSNRVPLFIDHFIIRNEVRGARNLLALVHWVSKSQQNDITFKLT